MSNDCENLYKVCRTSAGLTQEQAAELLGVAPRTLSDYENERTRVPDDIVDAMSRIYKEPRLPAESKRDRLHGSSLVCQQELPRRLPLREARLHRRRSEQTAGERRTGGAGCRKKWNSLALAERAEQPAEQKDGQNVPGQRRCNHAGQRQHAPAPADRLSAHRIRERKSLIFPEECSDSA